MELAIYQELFVNESSGVLQVRELFLTRDPQNDSKLMEQWRKLIAATFNSPQRSTSPPSALSSVRLVGSLQVQQFAVICSSLRYGSPFEKLWLTLRSQPQLSPEENAQYWRWIAFGIF